MKRILPLVRLVLCLFALFPFALSAQQKEPVNSLLWRISGNGLSKPSWLYGTIHLMDKQVFDFGDSVYAALESCEGYAMELAADTIMKAAFSKLNEEKVLLKDALTAKEFTRIKKKLQERFSKRPETVTVKEFRSYFINSVNKPGKDGMHTIMDAYFYDAMRRQGKWVGGVEDLTDQEGIGEDTPLKSYIEDFLNDLRGSKQTLDKMIRIYKEEDLEAVGDLEGGAGVSMLKDSIMLRRNRKMSYRMDSLARMRSTFFAVGTGHLPGDSGVINYLRKRGFTVQPVVSSRRIHANAYHFPEKEMPWVTVAAANGHYTVQLPGQPQQMEVTEESVDMKMYADISSNMFYLSMSLEGKDNFNIDSLFTKMVKNLNQKATIQATRSIVMDSVAGKEVIAKGTDATYRMRCYYRAPIAYLVMVGSTMDTLIHSKDAERFFQSLVMHKWVKSGYEAWSSFVSDRHAFSLKFPGKPVAKTDPDDGSNVITTTYSSLDVKNDAYFQCIVQDMKKGYYLTGDTTVFGAYREFIAGCEECRLPTHRQDTIQDYPAMWSGFMRKHANANYYNKVLSLHRGNRIYHVVVTVADSVKSRQAMKDYFSSFTFQPLKESKWSKQPAPDNSFTAWSATAITPYVDTSASADKDPWYIMYDSVAPCTYYLQKTPYQPYFWVDNDTALLRRTVNNSLNYNDSLLSYIPVSNGDYRGAEATVSLPDNHNVKKMRLLIVGDSLFTIYGIAAPEIFATGNSQRLFKDLSITHTTPSTIFTSKAAALLKALQTADSAQFDEAKATLNLVTFAKSDLPLLHTAMLQRYQDSSNYINVNNRLFSIVASFKEESTLAYVKQAWKQLPAEKEDLRYGLLGTVAGHGTAASVALAKDLLLQHPPKEGEPYHLFNPLSDSMALVAPIFPDLLPLLKDSLAAGQIIYLAQDLLDSNLLDIREVLKYKGDLYRQADKTIKGLQANTDEPDWISNHYLIRLLTKLKEPAAYQWVRKFLLQSNQSLKYSAAIALLKAGQPVEAAQLLKLAADKEHRVDLYNDLQQLQKIALFPKQYLTQQAFAESEVYTAATDDNEVKKMTLIGERVAIYKGVRKKFFLYRVDMSYEDEKIIHLGVAGPYNLKPGALVTAASAVGIYWDKEYNAATIDADLKAFLKQYEQYDEQ